MKRFFLTALFMCLFFSISTLADVEVYFVPYVGDIDGSVDTGWFSFYEQLRQWHDDNLIPVGLSFYPETMNNQRFNQIIADMYMSNSVELILKGEDEYGGKRIDLMPYEEAKQALEAWQNKFVAELENLGYSNIKKPVTYNQLMGKFTENIRDAAHELGFKIYLEQYVSEYGNIDMLPDFDITQYSVSLTTSVEAGPNTEFKTPERVIQELLDFNDGHLIYINGVKVVPLLSHQQDFRISYGSSTVDQQKWDIYTGLLLMARDDPRIYLLKPEEVYDLRHPSAAICGNNIVEYGEQCDDGNNINGDGCSSTCQTEGKGKVIFSMDDSQLNWLEDIAVAVTEINIEEGIDIVLNVIPYRISASNVLGPKLQEWNNNYKDFIEIAEHGYTHDRNEYNMGSMSYNQQRTIIENGLNELRLLGIEPKLFTPPGGSQNANTLNVLGDLGLHTDLDCWTGIDSSSGILVLKQCGALLCDVYGVSGPNCNFKSTSALMNDIDNMINNYGYAVVAFHMQDFETSSGRLDTSKINEYRQLLRNLKDLGKYQFMTAEEFYRGTIAECGNGILETGEECDDGNLLSGDGCSSDCKIELSACVDGDSDGYYAVDTGCLVGNDCDDANITINPGASETECDGVNNDCDGDIDEDYAETQTTCGVGACSANGLLQCVDGNEIDSCTPGIPAANDSSCDGIDDDCDGTNDEDYVSQQTSCGIGACYATGLTSCVGGLIKDSCMPGQPQPEVCEGLIDEDCDGLIDLEDSDCFNCIDNDNDNHYSMEGYCPNSDDCDDNNNTIYPGASEAGCDGVDNDCDDLIDEDYVITGTSCGIGACYARGELSCLGGVEVDSCTPGIPALNDSTCDGIDDDCDGIIDEDCKPVCGVCVNSTMVCPDGFIAECGNTCDELTGLCSNCTPSCEGHEEVVYREVLYTFKVSSWNDDAFEYNNNVNINGAAIGMGNRRYGGFRFNNVDIPKGAIIEDARLSLAYNWASSSTVNLILYGEDSDNAFQFKTTSKDISNRTKTKSSIIWNNLKKVSWGTYQISPNISQIIQEIINRPNWNEGNSIVILGYESSNSIWEAVSYEGTSWNKGLYGAKLQITASVPHQCIESWSCTEWSKCIDGSQMRECNDMNNCGTINNKPIEKQDCVCNEYWNCTEWGECIQDQEFISVSYYVCNETTRTCIEVFIPPNGTQTRTCTDLNSCGTEERKPAETLNCKVNLCKDIICNDSELLCQDGFIATCENNCNNNTKSCSNCTPDCIGHEDLCEGIICEDSELACPDGFVSTCENTCDSLTGLCNDCIPNCEGHNISPSLCKGVTCEDSVFVCPDGFISSCTNNCNEEDGLCSQCVPSCEGHEQISYHAVAYTYKTSSGYDDAYERNGNMYLNGATIDIGNGYYGGFRFNNIQLPKGSIIKDAKLSLAYNWASSSVSNILLYGENSDNAKQFQSTSKDITNRARTKGVTWTNLVKGNWGAYQTSPNISIIIQEITDRTNWKNGSSISILGYYLSGGIWEAVSYEGTDWNPGVYSAKLEIKALIPTIPANNTNNINTTPPAPSNSTGIILVQLDDTSPEQLDIANLAVEKFHNEGIAITPELWSAGLSTSPQLNTALLWDSWSEVEIAQGVYSGDSCGNSLTNDIRNGKLEYANAGITQPTSYLPHMCYPSSSALDDLRDEGILVVIDYASPDVVRNGDPSNPSQQPLTIYDGRDIAEGGLDSYNTILSSVRLQIAEKGYADLAFHVWAIDESMSNNIVTMMKRLRDEEGYTFMTATEYYHSIWG